MPCRVGMTTDRKRRRREWQNEVVGLKDLKTVKTFRSQKKAQEFETQYAEKHGCEAHAGGPKKPGKPWYVYHFKFTKKRSKKR